MKIFVPLMVLYFFSASALPCSDVSEIIFSAHGSHDAKQTSDASSDHCSSLCICNCCSIVCETPAEIVLPDAPFTYAHRLTSTILRLLTDERSSVWQPPKLA